MAMTKNQLLDLLQEKFFDLRNAQANCTPAEREAIQREIEKVLETIDKVQRM